jgi:hypothetical protein
MHEAAAILTFLSPGLRFFHQGQLQGRRKRISPHLVRAPDEPVNKNLELFYSKLLEILHQSVFRNGNWQLLDCNTAWDGNWSNDNYISFSWQGAGDEKMVVAVNYSNFQSQCYIKLPYQDIGTGSWVFNDLISGNIYEREGADLQANGLYLDESAWKTYVFTVNMKKE